MSDDFEQFLARLDAKSTPRERRPMTPDDLERLLEQYGKESARLRVILAYCNHLDDFNMVDPEITYRIRGIAMGHDTYPCHQ